MPMCMNEDGRISPDPPGNICITSIFYFSICCSKFFLWLKKKSLFVLVYFFPLSFPLSIIVFLSLRKTSIMHRYLSISMNLLSVLVFPPSFERTEDLVTSSYRQQKFALSLLCTLTPNSRRTSEFYFFKALGCFKTPWTVQNMRAGAYVFVWHSLY